MLCARTSCGAGTAADRWRCALADRRPNLDRRDSLCWAPISAGGEQPQFVVPGGIWQSATPAGQEPVLVSCVVAPGFDFADFRLG
jgi:uncharacterized protein